MNRLEQLDIQLTSETKAKLPEKVTLEGRYVRLEPLNTEKHHQSLYENLRSTPDAFDWLFEPFVYTPEDFRLFCLKKEQM